VICEYLSLKVDVECLVTFTHKTDRSAERRLMQHYAGHREKAARIKPASSIVVRNAGGELFDAKEVAEAYLLGRETRPILPEKKKAKQAEGGE
jgi:hypothetical protein